MSQSDNCSSYCWKCSPPHSPWPLGHRDKCVPDGAAEQDGVLQDDGQSRAQSLQRQLGNVDFIDYNPPLETESEGQKINIAFAWQITFASDIFSKLFSTLVFFDLQTCPPCGRRPKRRRICRCPSCHRSPPGNKHTQRLFNSLTWDLSLPFRSPLGFKSQHVGYLLPRADVRVDIFEHRLQGGVVSDTQVLDLDLSVLRPAIGNLRHSWDTHCPGSFCLSKLFSFNRTDWNRTKWCNHRGHQSGVIWLERLMMFCVFFFIWHSLKKEGPFVISCFILKFDIFSPVIVNFPFSPFPPTYLIVFIVYLCACSFVPYFLLSCLPCLTTKILRNC